MVNILLNAATAASVKIECKAEDALQRDRFSSSSVQTTGNVYISNKYRPSTDLSSPDWIKIQPLTTGLVVVDFPVAWIAADADFQVCSFCEGNS